MSKELREALTSFINMLLFALSLMTLVYLGSVLVLSGYDILGMSLMITTMTAGFYILLVKPEVIK